MGIFAKACYLLEHCNRKETEIKASQNAIKRGPLIETLAMQNSDKIFREIPQKGRIIEPLRLEGPQQMAIDELLLEQAISIGDISIAIRFYTWDGNWLSIGKNQKEIPNNWTKLAKENKISLVKRPSGGNAVLHSGGLTYAIILKYPPSSRHLAYFQNSEWLIRGFSSLGINLKFGTDSARDLPLNCFSTSTKADLLDDYGEKRIGSAQYWKKGHLLQHGEIILNPPYELWEDLFQSHPPSAIKGFISTNDLIEILTASIKSYWIKTNWETNKLSLKELQQIKLTSDKYSINHSQLGQKKA